MLGAEAHPAYNRILLSAVLAGTMSTDAIALHDREWAERHHVDLRLDTAVIEVDREVREVVTGTGDRLGYDTLVLATGSRAWLPPVDGLAHPDGTPADGVSVFRDLDDCRRILELAEGHERHVAVLGGGLLGLEAARGLTGRGVRVTVLHPQPHLMERQLDRGAGRVLARSLSALGVDVRLAVGVTRWRPGQGLETTRHGDGTMPCDAVVVAAGVRAETGLAERAGLVVDSGIRVDDRLASSDARIHALGDCAQHPGTAPGLLTPAWEQATVLADLLTGSDPDARYHGSRLVTRLKARGLDLAVFGASHDDDHDDDHDDSVTDGAASDGAASDGAGPERAEVLRFSDAARGRYAKLVLRDDRVTGGILLGVPDAAATVVQLYERGTPAPTDRLALLLGRALPDPATPVESAAHLPARAVVCRCNTVTKGSLVAAWRAGARDADALGDATRAGTGCGSCRDVVTGLCDWLTETDPPSGPDVDSSPDPDPAQEGAA